MTSPRDQLEGKIEEVIEAYRRARQAEYDRDYPVVVEQLDDIGNILIDIPSDPPAERQAREAAEGWKPILTSYTEPFMGAEWESVQTATDAIADGAHELRLNAGVEQGSDPMREIEAGITGWRGLAAEVFRAEHLPRLDTALSLQYEFAVALGDVIKVHAGVVEYAFRNAKDLLQRAKESLDAEAEQERRENRDNLRQFVTGVIMTGIAYATGGPQEAAKTALQEVGKSLAYLEFTPSGRADDILNGLVDALSDLQERIEQEEEEIRHALVSLDEFLNGDKAEEFMPKTIDPMLRDVAIV